MIAFIKSLGGEGETYILYCNTNGSVYDCIREIGLLLSNEHSQITFTYRLPAALSHGYNCKRLRTTFNSICVRQTLLIILSTLKKKITHTMTAIFLIMTSNFVIADKVLIGCFFWAAILGARVIFGDPYLNSTTVLFDSTTVPDCLINSTTVLFDNTLQYKHTVILAYK